MGDTEEAMRKSAIATLFLLLSVGAVSVACSAPAPASVAPAPPVAYEISTPASGPVAIPIQNPPDAEYPLVRSGPSYELPAIGNQLELGEAAPVVGRNAQGDWWQVEVHREIGWLPASAVQIMGDAGSIPIVPTPTLVP